MVLTLADKPDRDLVIVGVNFMEVALEQSLRESMTSLTERQSQNLFGSANGPLSTLSQKIAIAHAMGLLTTHVFEEFSHIRGIRNQFAHSIEDLNLDTPHIRDKVANLKFWLEPQEGASWRSERVANFGFEVVDNLFASNSDGSTLDLSDQLVVVSADNSVAFNVPTNRDETIATREKVLYSIWACIYFAVVPAAKFWAAASRI